MEKYKALAERINYGLFLVTVFLLPFPQIFLRYAYVFWLVSWVAEGRWLHRPKPIKENKMLIPVLLFGLWYLWKILTGLWAPDHAAWAAQMERYLTFGVLLPIFIWGVNAHYDWRQIGRVLVIGCVCTVFFYPALLTVLFYHRELIDILHWVAPWDYSSDDWLYFYQFNISHIKHRLFLSSVEILGMIAAVQLWCQRRALWITLTVLMAGSCLFTGSRQSILTIAVVASIAIILNLPKQVRWKSGIGIILIGLILGCGILSFQPRMQHFNVLTENRTLIWERALDHPSDYFWHGLGAGQDRSYLTALFNEAGWPANFWEVRHCHCQYLQELMELGIGGLLLFLCAWLSIPLCANNKGRQTAILFTALYACNMFTDCMFGLFCGVALWAVGVLFISLQSDTAREQ